MSVTSKIESIWEKYFSQFMFVSFWLLGMCNNFPFIIMLSAGHDLLKSNNSTSVTINYPVTLNYIVSSQLNETKNLSISITHHNDDYKCNALSTGAILLADILPGLCVKLVAPFFIHRIKYWIRVCVIISSMTISFLIVSLTPKSNSFMIINGVRFSSFASSLGEISFLSLLSFYPSRLSLAGWASGTGFAGLFASYMYAQLTSLGMSTSTTILSMLFVPVLMGLAFSTMPSIRFAQSQFFNLPSGICNQFDLETIKEMTSREAVAGKNNAVALSSSTSSLPSSGEPMQKRNKFIEIRPLLKFMIPLFFVYYSEYLINQGLFELIYFRDTFMKDRATQYRWFNFVYRLGVFLARSSIYFVQIEHIIVFALLQVFNMFFVFSHVIYNFIPSIFIMLALIFWEGLIGGAAYANSFNMISKEIPSTNKEFSMGIVPIADSFGVAFAGLSALPVHYFVCNSQL